MNNLTGIKINYIPQVALIGLKWDAIYIMETKLLTNLKTITIMNTETNFPETNFPKTVAGVIFTKTGILIEKAYQYNTTICEVNEFKFTGEYLKIAKRLAKARMAHCKQQLHANLSNATYITEHIIAWPGGHFGVPVYEALEGILELTDVRLLNKLQAQQLIRAMLLNGVNNYVYDYDENLKRCDNDICVTDDFKNFITEHMLCL